MIPISNHHKCNNEAVQKMAFKNEMLIKYVKKCHIQMLLKYKPITSM